MLEKTNHLIEFVNDHWAYFLAALAAVSGLIGGCATGIIHAMQGQRAFTWALVFAYGFVGLINAILAFFFVGYLVGYDDIPSTKLIAASFTWGGISTGALLAQNVSARWTLRLFGQEVVQLNGEQHKSNNRKKRDSDK